MERLKYTKMVFNDYFKKELIALRTEGAQFSKRNPGLSSYLSKEGQDPDVERLLEGFAFLTGRLKQQLDQELPEVAHTLVELLWPNYTRAIPSFSIIQFDPNKDSVENVHVKKGTEVLSRIKADAIQCRFQTIYDTLVMPLGLNNVNYYISGKESILELKMQMTASGTLNEITLGNLRIYLSGSKFIAQDIYLFLMNFVQGIDIHINDSNDQVISELSIDKNSIKPVGFGTNDTLTPKPQNIFDGYFLIQDFFCFKDKFLFVDISNLAQLKNLDEQILKQSRSFTIRINFSKKIPHNNTISKEHFSLYSTPIVNLFETDSVPIRKNLEQSEFIVVPADLDKNHSEVFAVEQVRGWIAKKNTYQNYLPFESFEHLDDNNEYYSSRTKLTRDGDRTNTYLRFSNTINAQDTLTNTNSTVSVKILCTNKDIPSTLLLGDICISNAISNTTNLNFKNITIPTESYPPPIDGDFLWRIISNMSLNYLSIKDIKTFRTIIETYDFFGAHDTKQSEKTSMMLKGITSIDYTTTQMMYEGLPIRGMLITISIHPSNFSCLGEAYLFCSVLNEFFGLYSNINSFHKLTVDIQKDEFFTWPIKLGTQEII